MLGNGSTAIAAVRRLMQIFQRVGVAKNTLSDHSPLELSHVLFASIEAEVDAAFTDIVRQKTNLIIAIDPFLLATPRPTPEPGLESIRQESFCSWRLESASRRPACCTSWPTLGPRRDFCSTEEARAQWRLDRAAPAFQPPYCWEAAVPWLPT
jgi:hypothetical protein